MLPLWGQIWKVLFFLQSDVFDQNCEVSDCKILGMCLTLGTCRIKCPLIGRILPRYHAESFHEIGSACANQCNVCRRSAKELSSIYESAITARLFPENPFKVRWNFHRQNWMKIQIAGVSAYKKSELLTSEIMEIILISFFSYYVTWIVRWRWRRERAQFLPIQTDLGS